jgi:hypothetical protein
MIHDKANYGTSQEPRNVMGTELSLPLASFLFVASVSSFIGASLLLASI